MESSEADLAEFVAKNDYESLKNFSTNDLSQTNFSVPIDIRKPNLTNRDALDYIGVSLIHIAALADALECFKYLEQNTRLNYKTLSSTSKNCIHYCCEGGSIHVLSYIFSQCKEGQEKYELKKIFHDDYSKEQTYLSTATLANSNDSIKLLFENGYGFDNKGIDRRSDLVNTPITISIKRDFIDCLKTLFNYYNNEPKGELSLLQIAISSKMINIVNFLLDSGCKLDYINSEGETALSCACIIKNVQIVKLLCDRMTDIDIPITEPYGSAIHWMCRSGNPEIMRIMLAHKPDLNRLDFTGRPGIACLATAGRDEKTIIEMLDLLEQNGYNMNDPKFPAITFFLTSINVKPNLIEWFLERHVDLDLPIKNYYESTKTIRQVILDKQRSPGFRQLIDKYHLDQK